MHVNVHIVFVGTFQELLHTFEPTYNFRINIHIHKEARPRVDIPFYQTLSFTFYAVNISF